MCSKKHPGLAVIDLHLLLGQLDVHPLPDELRRDAVAMRAVGSVESNAVSLVHGVDLPFAVLIGMSGQRLQTALLLFLKTSSSRNVSSLPGALIEFVHVFANHLLKLLPVFGQCMSFGLQMELSDDPSFNHVYAGFHAIFVLGMLHTAGLSCHAVVFT